MARHHHCIQFCDRGENLVAQNASPWRRSPAHRLGQPTADTAISCSQRQEVGRAAHSQKLKSCTWVTRCVVSKTSGIDAKQRQDKKNLLILIRHLLKYVRTFWLFSPETSTNWKKNVKLAKYHGFIADWHAKYCLFFYIYRLGHDTKKPIIESSRTLLDATAVNTILDSRRFKLSVCIPAEGPED